ncbi:energy-coupling factor transporter transmembrane component T [Bacillus sp. B15-48]|uniref:energy-coupling factor transporter transmembrane component T family protein n=1 Tax=Bacillus sp. B15-48 TaxID=1548601 RepID=UPI00193F2BB9|nr:energy-coupling factor transporter transmembrane component T [Bacillus sp. B15-48]MBM4765263.1 hypothetical protein [Bacillus sp. B15-48]
MGMTFVEEIKQFDSKIPTNSWGLKWEVRSKLITCLLTTFAIISLKTPMLLAFIFFSLIVVILSMGFRLRFVLSKLILLLPFLFLMSGPILLAGGLSLDIERVEFVINLNLKALSASILMLIILLSQPIPQLINGLSHLKIPAVLVSIFMVSLHYVRLFYLNLLTYQKALISRFFKPTSNIKSLKVFSSVIAGFVLRSVDQSDRAYQAMVSRGFSGVIPTAKPQKMTSVDYIKSGLFLFVIVVLLIIEKWWLI